MKALSLFVKKPIVHRLALLLLMVTGLFFQWAVAQEVTEPTKWVTLMEVKAIGYEKTANGRSFQFFPLDAKGQSISNEQAHDYMFEWDFGNGIYSLEAFPVMAFDQRPPDVVTLRLTAIKETDDPTDVDRRTVRPKDQNCMVTETFVQDGGRLRRGDVLRDLYEPKIEIVSSNLLPVGGKCATYLVKIEMPTKCKYSGTVKIVGNVVSYDPEKPAAPAEVIVTDIPTGPGMKQLSNSAGTVTLHLDAQMDATYYALLKCRVGAGVLPGQFVHWTVQGDFAPERGTSDCSPITVTDVDSSQVVGSLDPSELLSLDAPDIRTGEVSRWKLVIENEGNRGETYVEATVYLPKELDLSRFRFVQGTWHEQPILPRFIRDSIAHTVKFEVQHPCKDSLEHGEKITLCFEAPVIAKWDCPKCCKFGCSQLPQRPITHKASIKFSGATEWAHLANEDLKLECTGAKQPKLITGKVKHHYVLKALVASAVITIGTLFVVQAVE